MTTNDIIVESPPNFSFVLAKWQHRTDGLAAICNLCFGWGFNPQIFPPPWGIRVPHLTQCVTGPSKCTCQITSKSVKWCRRNARM